MIKKQGGSKRSLNTKFGLSKLRVKNKLIEILEDFYESNKIKEKAQPKSYCEIFIYF